MIYIIIPVFNRIEKTLKCLESIFAQEYLDIEVVVVDDGSTDGTKEVVNNTYPDVVVLDGTGILFWTGSVHLGISYVLNVCSREDWVLLVNNDVQFGPKVIEKLISFSTCRKRKAIVNALSIDLRDGDTIIKSGTIVKSWTFNITKHVFRGESLEKLQKHEPIQVDLLTGRCLLHPVEVFWAIGNYDSKNFPHYGGDDEYSARAKAVGYELYVLPSAIVYLDTKNNDASAQTVGRRLRSMANYLFGIRSNINLYTKWKIARKIVPSLSIPTYYLIGVLKSLYVLVRKN